MFVLHRWKDSSRADEIQDRLEDLVVAHRVSYERPRGETADLDLPILVEGDDTYVGDDISRRLDALESDLTFSRQISADACYVDLDNPEQCI